MKKILKANIDDPRPLMDAPVVDIVAGHPQPRSKVLHHLPGDPNGGMSGIFSADPGALRLRTEVPEALCVVEGHGSVESDQGERLDFHPGDVVVLPAASWLWTFETSFRAVFAVPPGH